jgi:hypothetical protein
MTAEDRLQTADLRFKIADFLKANVSKLPFANS